MVRPQRETPLVSFDGVGCLSGNHDLELLKLFNSKGHGKGKSKSLKISLLPKRS